MSKKQAPFAVMFVKPGWANPVVHEFKGKKRRGMCMTVTEHSSPRLDALRDVALNTVRQRIGSALGIDPLRVSFDGACRPWITLDELPTPVEARRLAERLWDEAYTHEDASDLACNAHRPDLWGDRAYRGDDGLMWVRETRGGSGDDAAWDEPWYGSSGGDEPVA